MWLWIVATVVAYFVKGLCGFANSLIFSSILGFGANNINITPVELMLSYPANIIMTYKNREKLDAKVYVPLAILVLLGSVPGALLLKTADAHALKIFFGIVVILMGIEMYLRSRSTKQYKESKVVMAIIGIVCGVLCGLFSVGALLSAYVSRVTKSTDEFKANINAVFILENTFRAITYIILGLITVQSLKTSLMLFPFMLVAMFAGMKCSKHMDDKVIQNLVVVLLIVSGIALIGNNI